MGWISKIALGLGSTLVAATVYRKYAGVDFSGKSVLITGGSRGLGLELAREFLAEGARVMLLARDGDELERARAKLGGRSVQTTACDVRNVEEIKRAVNETRAAFGGIDVLVNAAGVIDVAPLEDLSTEDFDDSLATHFWGPLHLIREVADQMEPGGRIINISSIGGLVAVPHLLSYSAGKFALTGLSEGLSAELANRQIWVTTVCPGLMRTGSHVKARFKGKTQKEFAWFAVSAGSPLTSMSSRRAARKIVAACGARRPFLVLTPQARALQVLHAVAPNTTTHIFRAAAKLLPEPGGGDRKREGWQSTSEAAPSMLTRLADRQIEPNNELRPEDRARYE